MVKAIPDGYRAVTPHLVVKGAAQALEFYQKAFDAEILHRMEGPGGLLMHAEIKIGDCIIMLADEMPMMEYWVSPPSLNGTTMGLALYSEDCDAAFQKAVDAGAQALLPPTDMFWGDRYGKVQDPFGHHWEICTHTEDLTDEEISNRAEAFMAQMQEQHGGNGCA